MKEKVAGITAQTFSSLKIRNFKLYFIGQSSSLIGTWLQTIAQSWLMYVLTGSGTYVGLLTAAQFLPVLLLGPFGGVIVDRYSKRMLLILTQAVAMILSLVLAIIVLADVAEVWMIFLLAALLGVVRVVDNPARHTFVQEMVGRDQLKNAIVLNSVAHNMARIIGPAIAGILIAGVGIGYCFLINALTYIPILIGLKMMNSRELQTTSPVVAGWGRLLEGFRYVRDTPVARKILLIMAAVGTLAYEFPVVLPLLAADTFHSGAGGFSLLMSAMGIGAVLGGLITAGQRSAGPNAIALAAIVLGMSMLLVSITPTIITAAMAMVLVGYGSISFTSAANSTLQMEIDSTMRGRVMAFWTMALIGSTPIGGPLIGYISEHASPRLGLVIGGCTAIAAGLYAYNSKRPKNKKIQRVDIPPIEVA